MFLLKNKRHLFTALFISLFSVLMGFAPVRAYAEYVSDENRGWTYERVMDEFYQEDKGAQFRRGQSPIGMTNFNRRVNLPKVRKGDSALGVAVGALRLHPAFSQIFEFDDNVRLSRNDREADAIFKELPALTAEIQRSENLRVSGGYGMEIVNFADQTEENAVNHFAHGLIEAYANNWRLIIEDTFQKEQSRLSNAGSERDDLLANSVQAIAKYKGSKWLFEPGWSHHTIEHESVNLKPFNYNEDIATITGGYKLGEKNQLILQNDVGFTYYDQKTANADQFFWQIFGGIRGEYSNDLTTELKAGFQARRSDEFSGQSQQQDYNGLVVDSNIAYQIGPKDAVLLDYVRNVQNSTFQNNSWFAADKVALSYSKRFFSKWVLTPQVFWQYNRYPQTAIVSAVPSERSDHLLGAGLDLRYQVKEWLSSGVGYRFRDRSSSIHDFEYDSNRMICDISLSY